MVIGMLKAVIELSKYILAVNILLYTVISYIVLIEKSSRSTL